MSKQLDFGSMKIFWDSAMNRKAEVPGHPDSPKRNLYRKNKLNVVVGNCATSRKQSGHLGWQGAASIINM
jgi:hypothetical protein